MKRDQLGKLGEKKAAEFLKRHGYNILDTNFRTKLGEIDIIARERDVICFVEVRTRTTDWHGHPFESISYKKKGRIIKSAMIYLKYKNLWNRKARFDVVSVIPQCPDVYDIEVIKNAFEINE